MLRHQHLLFCILAVGLVSACSNTAPSSTNEMSAVVSTLNENINAVSGILDQTRRSAFTILPAAGEMTRGSSFGSAWTTTTPGIRDPETNTMTNISFQDYMGSQLDPDAQSEGGGSINVFGRMNNAFQIFCAVGVGAEAAGYTIDSYGYLEAGTYTVTFSSTTKSSMTTTCGIDTSTIPDNTEMTMTVTTGGTNYDRKLTFDFFDQAYWVKNDATVLRVATAENTDEGFSRTLAEFNKTTNVTRAEAIWVAAPSTSSSMEAARIYYDADGDEGMVLSYRGFIDGSPAVTDGVRYILAGKPENGDAFSISLRADTEMGDTNSYEACVSSTDGSILTDGARCSATGTRLNGADISGSNGILSTWFTAYSANSDSQDWGTAELTDADVVPFTDMTDLPTTSFTP